MEIRRDIRLCIGCTTEVYTVICRRLLVDQGLKRRMVWHDANIAIMCHISERV
jgi:hypothetical protein